MSLKIKVPNIIYLGSAVPSGGGSAKQVALLSITTAPAGTFEKGSQYYNSAEKIIYTAVEDNTWDGAKPSNPQFNTYYIYNNQTYVWDGNSLELFELEEYQKKLVSGENIKTINGDSVLGSGNLAVKTYQVFPSSWHTTTTFSEFLNDINSDNTAVEGMAYLGDLACSGLPTGISNAEVVVEIINSTTNSKCIHVIMTSGDVYPYRWEYTYWNNGSSVSGWIGFQPELPSQTGQSGKFLTTNGTTISWADVQKIITFTNKEVSVWLSDSTYTGYGYKAEINCAGVTSSMVANVIFAPTEADSGNYATVCDTDTNTVTIYSKVNTTITIPTIVAMEG